MKTLICSFVSTGEELLEDIEAFFAAKPNMIEKPTFDDIWS